jgi:hypothetical protein
MILQAVILHITLIGRAALARRGKRGPHTFVSWQEEVWRGPVTVCVCVCVCATVRRLLGGQDRAIPSAA